MSYRWKPSQSQKKEYAEKMREAEELFSFIKSNYPLRVGCKIEWADKATNNVLAGEVVNSSYGAKTGQHTFTILISDGTKILVKGRNIYDRLLIHEPGIIAKDRDHPLNNLEKKIRSHSCFD